MTSGSSRLHQIVSDLFAPCAPQQLACEIDGGYVFVVDDRFVVNVVEDVVLDRIRVFAGVRPHDHEREACDESLPLPQQWIKANALDEGVAWTVGIEPTRRLFYSVPTPTL